MKKHLFLFLSSTFLSIFPIITQAQTYTPSNRTPREDNSIGTIVNPAGANFNITGGLQRGQNLFHSFTDFSVPTGGSANFTNPQGNQSIITRITGNLFSDINGLVNTNGANFLLINPNGVVFGTNAQLNVGKAFVTSTANGIDFVDAAGGNYNFGVNQAGDAPLLSIGANVAFNPARLIVGGSNSGSKGIENYGTLRTNNPGQYIGLIGGNVNFNGGQIIAPGAKVELGGLVQSGTVGFSLDNGIEFPVNVARGNVSLVPRGTSPSVINVQSGGGGSVWIVAKDITVQGSVIGAGIAANLGSPTARAGDVKLDATGDIRLSDAAFVANQVGIGAEGKAGNIEVVTGNLSVTNGSQLVASTYGKGDAGNIKITASDGNVSFDGVRNGSTSPSAAFSEIAPEATGKGGNVELVARNLSVTNGARLSTSTYGTGDTGNIKITATDNISLDGFPSALVNAIDPGATGQGGNIELFTRNLSVTNGARLSASTFAKGDAGGIKITATGNISFDGFRNSSSAAFSTIGIGGEGKSGGIEIVTSNLSVTNGAQLQDSTFGKGDAGNIKITATNSVYFDGFKGDAISGAYSAIGAVGAGKGGGIEIVTGNLSVTNGAELSTSSLGNGDAGDILLKSKTITLNNGAIGSQSTNSTGGNINLSPTDYLLLQNNSFIATDSDSTGKNGNGGNITINSPLIIATPGNNNINANAYNGTGGRVNITSQGLFGIQYRPTGSDFTNDITASSTFGQSGNVQINTPGIDPGKDTGELPAAPNDASRQISETCSASQRDNKFYITGRGGLPPNASEPQESEALWQDARAVKHKPATTANQPAQLAPPAIGWVFEQNGRVRLIAAQTAGGVTGTRASCPNVRK
jgi:filamentous hemagglutinin family protein